MPIIHLSASSTQSATLCKTRVGSSCASILALIDCDFPYHQPWYPLGLAQRIGGDQHDTAVVHLLSPELILADGDWGGVVLSLASVMWGAAGFIALPSPP